MYDLRFEGYGCLRSHIEGILLDKIIKIYTVPNISIPICQSLKKQSELNLWYLPTTQLN